MTEPVGEEPSVEASTAPPLRATAAAPADLWIVGDSLTETFGPALAEAARATGVLLPDHELRYSSGLTRPDFYDWPARLARRLAEGELDIIVFMIGANDAQAIETSGGWVDFGSSAWMEEYRRRVKQTAETLSVGARTVYWVGQPIARPATYSQRMGILNDIYRSVAESHPGIRYVSSWELFATEGSSYADRLADRSGTEVRVRAADGIHLTTAGGERLSAHVIQSIEQDWVLGR
ncbi:MAG: DUF459 domain-containing protein [Nitriliruptorales bacterium]|nr:DUF459 domain-containing protein [Nitriliruptorales bacterium]